MVDTNGAEMKKYNKFYLMLAILVATFMCVVVLYYSSANAESHIQLSIVKKNLAFENEVHILYAVDSNGVTDERDIKVLIYNEPQSEYVYGKQDETLDYACSMEIGGKFYPIFVLGTLSAKQMTDSVYAVAYYNGVYSAPVKYSILQYAYNRLQVSENAAFKELLVNMLEYGTSAQKYFGYHTERLANSVFYSVHLEDGVLSDGFADGLYASGTEICLTCAEKENKTFKDWVDGDNNVLGTDSTLNYTVTKDITISARYEDVYSDPTFVVDKVAATAGQKNVAVNVAVKNNPGISSIKLVVTNDDGLTLTGFSYNSAVIGGSVAPYNANASKITLVWVNASADVNGDWVFATLYFDVSDSASGSYGISVSYDEDDVYNINEDNVCFDVVNGCITVE